MSKTKMGLPGQLWKAFKTLNVNIKVVPTARDLEEARLEDGTLFVCASEKEFRSGMIESIISNSVAEIEIPGVEIVPNRQYDGNMSAVPRLITGLLPLCDFLAVNRITGEYGYLVIGVNASGHTIPVMAAVGQLPLELKDAYSGSIFVGYHYESTYKVVRAVPTEEAGKIIWGDDVRRSYVLPEQEYFDDKRLEALKTISSDAKKVKTEPQEPDSPAEDEGNGAEPPSDSPSL